MSRLTCSSWSQESVTHRWVSIHTWPKTAAAAHNQPSPADPAEDSQKRHSDTRPSAAWRSREDSAAENVITETVALCWGLQVKSFLFLPVFKDLRQPKVPACHQLSIFIHRRVLQQTAHLSLFWVIKRRLNESPLARSDFMKSAAHAERGSVRFSQGETAAGFRAAGTSWRRRRFVRHQSVTLHTSTSRLTAQGSEHTPDRADTFHLLQSRLTWMKDTSNTSNTQQRSEGRSFKWVTIISSRHNRKSWNYFRRTFSSILQIRMT